MVADKKHGADTASIMDQFTTMMQGLKVPGIDMNELLASQRKNIEACTKAAQIASEAAGAVARRQADIMRAAIAEATELMHNYNPSGRPDEAIARQAELAKKAFETGLANAKELADMVGKSAEEAFQVVQKRVTDGLEEIRRAAQKKD